MPHRELCCFIVSSPDGEEPEKEWGGECKRNHFALPLKLTYCRSIILQYKVKIKAMDIMTSHRHVLSFK